MAHQLIANKQTGKIPFAATGPRSEIWHGLGQMLSDGQGIDVWTTEAGMDWQVEAGPAQFTDNNGTLQEFPGRQVLRRSDTQEALSIVSDKFKIVQPRQVLEFFRDLTEIHGMKLSTAGCINNGTKYWALADVGKAAEVVPGDEIKGQLLLMSSVDGFTSTTAKFVSTRVVCSNTLDIAMRGGGKAIRITHKKEFDAKEVKIDLGLIDKSWDKFMADMKKFAAKPMDKLQSREFIQGLFYDPARDPAEQSWGTELLVERAIAMAQGGSGSEMHRGTRWGTLCGITEALTHQEGGRRSKENQFMDTYVGLDAQRKSGAYLDLLMLA